MKRVILYPYNLGSKSANALKGNFERSKCVRPDGNYRPYRNHIIINWGNSILPNWINDTNTHILNSPIAIKKAVNKLTCLSILKDNNIPTVEFTTDFLTAFKWFAEGNNVIERHNITGSKGDGIVVADTTLHRDVPMYSKFIEKAREYRVHVFNGKVIDIQQKKRRVDTDEVPDGVIKNLANGWVFTRDNITPPPEDINNVAINSIKALGLDFGAIDILTKNGVCYVLEVNTACGLEGSTLINYTNAIKEYADQ